MKPNVLRAQPDRNLWSRVVAPVGALLMAGTTLVACGGSQNLKCNPDKVLEYTAGSGVSSQGFDTLWDVSNTYPHIDNGDMDKQLVDLNNEYAKTHPDIARIGATGLLAGEQYVRFDPKFCS